MNQGGRSSEQFEGPPEQVVSGLRSLGLGWEWPADCWPTWADLLELHGPQRLETIETESVCDATLELLRYTPNITFLDLMSSNVTDRGMLALRYIPLLEDLWIINTKIGDAGIEYLLHHRSLKRVTANNSAVTIFGARLLNSSIPGCETWIGRRTVRGRVIEAQYPTFKISIRGRENPVIISAIVSDDQLEEFAEFLKAPIGRTVNVWLGEADEPNWIWEVRELPSGNVYATD